MCHLLDVQMHQKLKKVYFPQNFDHIPFTTKMNFLYNYY